MAKVQSANRGSSSGLVDFTKWDGPFGVFLLPDAGKFSHIPCLYFFIFSLSKALISFISSASRKAKQ